MHSVSGISSSTAIYLGLAAGVLAILYGIILISWVLGHSPGCRPQNSTHPGGGCVTSDTRTWASRSGPATAGSASMALAASTAIKTIPDFGFKALEIMAATFM